MEHLLFVCTGNFYRSRFAEIYFNHLARKQGLGARAFSRGLEVFKNHNAGKGPLSIFTVRYLEELGIPLPEPAVFPVQLEAGDFRKASQTILMHATEHQPMMQQYFPEWADRVTYWAFPDVGEQVSQEVLPNLAGQVQQLIASMT